MIVIPTYNEAENIFALVKKIRAVLTTEKILFVDDNSGDGTAEKVKSLQQNDPNIELIVRTTKRGFGSAYIDGFKYVFEKYPFEERIITMDGDLSHSPEAFVLMEKAFVDADVVVGSRYVKDGKTLNWSIQRRILSRLGNFYARFCTAIPVKDATSGFMMLRVSKLREINLDKVRTEGYAFLMDLKQMLMGVSAHFKEVPITFTERPFGKSKFSSAILMEGIIFPSKVLFWRLLHLNFKRFIGWFIFLSTFIVYFFTAPRSIFFGDNPEFISAVSTLGVAHPSGYPLYIILAKLFSFLPLGNFVLRVNLFSAFCASLSLVFIFLILNWLLGKVQEFFEFSFGEKINLVIAGLGVFGLAFSSEFWYQAIVAKVYTLNLLILLMLTWLVLKFWDSNDIVKKEKYVLSGALLFGLGFANHQTIILFIPLFILATRSVLKVRMLLKAIGLFILGSLVYLYIPISSAAHPGLDWGHTSESLKAFIAHIKRSSYNDFGGSFNIQDKVSFFGAFALNVFLQFKFWVIFIVLGLLGLIKSHKRFLAFAFGVIVINSLGIILLRSLSFNYEAAEFYRPYYLPAYTFVAVLIFAGLVFFGYLLSVVLPKVFNNKVTAVILCASLVLFGAVGYKANAEKNNLKSFDFLDYYSANILKSLPANSVLVFGVDDPAEDSILFALKYQQVVKHIGTDVHVLGYIDLFDQADRSAVNALYAPQDTEKKFNGLIDYAFKAFPGKSIYSTFIIENSKYSSASNGYAYLVYPKNQSSLVGAYPALNISDTDLKILQDDFFGREVLKHYYYSFAATVFNKKDNQLSQELFVKALELSNSPYEQQQQEFVKLRSRVLP